MMNKRLETLRQKVPIGTAFDRLTVIGYEIKGDVWCLRCKCKCGNETVQRRDYFLARKIRSCGCHIKERIVTYGIHKRLPPGESQLNSLFYYHGKHAEAKKIPTTLTKDQFKVLITGNCTYCSAPPSNTFNRSYTNGTFLYTGIDRIDSNKGYTPENSVSCCKQCNYAKQRMTVDEFKIWLRRAAHHFLGMR